MIITKLENDVCLCSVCNINVTLLTLKHRETHGGVACTVATDALVLKHQVISILDAD